MFSSWVLRTRGVYSLSSLGDAAFISLTSYPSKELKTATIVLPILILATILQGGLS